MSTVELDAMPAAGPLYRRAVTGLLPLPGTRRAAEPPDLELTVRGVSADRDHLARYDRVCGFRLGDRLPATYPHIMAFPLTLRLMTAPDFPIPLVGLVHLANRITVRRPLDAGQPLDFAARAGNLRRHARGRQLDLFVTGSVAGEEVWRGVSTYLHRERQPAGGESAPAESGGGSARPDPAGDQVRPAPSARWRFDRRVGPDYAAASGDRNPIHTSRLGARALGLSRPIAHGMYSKARCLAALDGRLPDGYTVDVAFKLPVPLPSTVTFGATPVGGESVGWDFWLRDHAAGKPHLTGTIR